jgi:hypothetical protein
MGVFEEIIGEGEEVVLQSQEVLLVVDGRVGGWGVS